MNDLGSCASHPGRNWMYIYISESYVSSFFKVTLWFPKWRSRFQPWKRHGYGFKRGHDLKNLNIFVCIMIVTLKGKIWPSSCSQNISRYCPVQPLYNPYIGGPVVYVAIYLGYSPKGRPQLFSLIPLKWSQGDPWTLMVGRHCSFLPFWVSALRGELVVLGSVIFS